MKSFSGLLTTFGYLLYSTNGQTCVSNLGGFLQDRFEPPTTDAVCFNLSTSVCPNGATYFGVDYDCAVASQGAERCFCTDDSRYIFVYLLYIFIL